jgi:hypothetical protein
MATGSRLRSAFCYRRGQSVPYGDEIRVQTTLPHNQPAIWIDWWLGTDVPVLVVGNASHAHAAEAPNLTQHHSLIAANGAHAHTADAPALVQHFTLVVQNAASAHTADAPALTQHSTLTVQGAASAHTADGLALVQHGFVVVASAEHAHTAGALTLVQHHAIVVYGAEHAHQAGALVLTQHQVLGIAQALHAHVADNAVLSTGAALIVASALHAHAAQNATLVYQYAIFGTIRDRQGAPVPYADVSLFNASTKALVYSGASDTAGRYMVVVSDNYTNHFLVAFYGASPRKVGCTNDTLKGK